MQITWLGTATILLTNDDNKILFDPYLAKYDENAFDFEGLDYNDIDAIFITHPHLDHFSDIAYFAKKTNCPIYVNSRGIEVAKKKGINVLRFREAKPNDIITIGTFQIKIYPGKHIHFDGKQKVDTVKRVFKNKMLKQAVSIAMQHLVFSMRHKDVLDFYVQSKEESVFVMGSAEMHSEVCYPKNIDTLVLPYQGRSDMCKHSAAIVKKLKPKRIFLDHFDDAFPPISHTVNLNEFLALMHRRKIPVIVPTKYEM